MSNATQQAASWLPPVEIDPSRPAQAPDETPFASAATDAVDAVATRITRVVSPQSPWTVPVFLGGIAALVLIALAFDAASLMDRSFAASYALGVAVTIVLAVTVGTSLKLALDEMLSIRRLRRIDALRAEATALTEANGHGSAGAFADTVAAFYAGREDLEAALDSLRTTVTDAHSDAEVVALIDRQVLTGIDQRAYACVLRASRDTALATALSPSAALDVVIVLWRNLKLVREVSSLYGARPGQLGSWRLMRRMVANLAVAGVAEGASHAAVDALGGSLAAAISTRLGQGIINGLLTARIGLAAMNLCRPVEFTAANKPSLRRIRSELLTVSKDVL